MLLDFLFNIYLFQINIGKALAFDGGDNGGSCLENMKTYLPAFHKLTSLSLAVSNSQFDILRTAIGVDVGSRVKTLSVKGCARFSLLFKKLLK